MIPELNARSREVFRFIVDAYLSTGAPVGSRTISTLSGMNLSAASIRNTMADLEDAGLLFSPHISAGRLPTPQGLRLYIDGLMQIGGITQDERETLEATCKATGQNMTDVLERSTTMLSGLSACASVVIAPKEDAILREIQFVKLQPRKILVVLVMHSGMIENRIMDVDFDLPPHILTSAANYLSAKLHGKTISEAERNIHAEIQNNQTHLDILAQKLVQMGLALPSPTVRDGHIIIRGQSRILQDVKAIEDLERARALLSYLEEQKNMLELLGAIDKAEGVQIFIGTENKIFDQSGWSIILSPYKNAEEKIIGAIGVIGPTRLDYDRIIPMVYYTSRLVSRLFGKPVDEV